MGSYVFKWPYPAEDVHVTGTFDDWAKSVQMEKVGDEWIKEVDLPLTNENVYYKFVVDGIWKVDANLQTEGDGHYNTNNVLYPHQIKRKSSELPGAFPETPAGEPTSFSVQPIPGTGGSKNPITVAPGATLPQPKDITSNTIESGVTTSKEDYEKAGSEPFPGSSTDEGTEFSVSPLPATSGAGNPVNVAPGAPLPAQKDITSNTIDSAVTTSQEDYEKAGTSTAIPETKPDDPTGFSVNPIPATSGAGNPINVAPGATLPDQKDITSNTVDSTVTTSKEDFEKAGSSIVVPEPETVSVNPIPASSGIGNPISLPAGEPIPDQKEITPHTVDSTVTTSKEDYERAGSSAVPASVAGIAGGALGGAAIASAFSTSKDKNIIPESSLPMGPGATSAIQPNPFISSTAGPGTTTSELASKVPLETKSTLGSTEPDNATSKLASELEVPLKQSPFIASSATGSTTANLAANVPFESTTTESVAPSVPDVVKESISSAHEAPEAAASTEAVREKADAEKELLSKTQTTGTTETVASGVPDVVQESIAKAHEDPEAAASPEAVKEKADLEKELLSKTETAETTESVAPGVPAVVQESLSKAHEDPEAAASPEVVKEKADLEKELLSKTQTSQATGQPATAAADQTSYYGLATTVPPTVEKSLEKAQASPEAAVESSAVAEKSAVEKELLAKVPSTDEAGEPAPTIAAATSTTAPTTTSPVAAATSVTDGKTANEPVPDTDTSTAARGTSAGDIAGGAAVGGAAAAGMATLAAKHNDADVEPPRISDSQKPDITTEATPATASTDRVPGQSAAAAAAVSDGGAATPLAEYPKTTAPVETTEGATTEYAPVRTNAPAPGVSSAAAAMLSDGTEDPALMDEPAVQMMNQNAGVDTAPKAVEAPTTTTTATPAVTDKDPSALVAAAGIPTITSAGTEKSKMTESKEAGPSTTTTSPSAAAAPATPVKQRPQSMAVSSPATSTATSTATDKKKKKRHRLSAFIHKIFD